MLIFQIIEGKDATHPGRGKPACTTHAGSRKPKGLIKADYIQRPSAHQLLCTALHRPALQSALGVCTSDAGCHGPETARFTEHKSAMRTSTNRCQFGGGTAYLRSLSTRRVPRAPSRGYGVFLAVHRPIRAAFYFPTSKYVPRGNLLAWCMVHELQPAADAPKKG